MTDKACYAELHAYSNFTFLEGACHPETLIERAVELELTAIALTDRDGLYGAVRFAGAARRAGIDAIIGSELTLEDGTRLTLLIEDERGYANLCELISCAQLRGSKGDARLQIEDLDSRSDGLVVLSRVPIRGASTPCVRAFAIAAISNSSITSHPTMRRATIGWCACPVRCT